MSKQGFRVLDSDLHVIEPQDLYERYLDRRYARRAPRPLEARQAYVSNWIVDGWVFPRPIGRGRPDAESRANVVLKEYAAAHFDSASQLRAMEVEGLARAVLFRTLPVVCVDAFDPEFAVGLCHAWNDWAADFVRPAPERMKAAALLTLHDATLAANELRRAVTDLGFIAAQMMPNPVNGVNLHDPRMDPLWAEAERLGVPICFHPAPNNYSDTHFVNRFLTRPSATITGGLNNPIELMSAIASMTVGGVLERFPQLRVGFLEGNCSWLPWLLWRLDEHWKMSKSGVAARHATRLDGTINPRLSPAPSKVFYDVMCEYVVYNDPLTLKAEPGLAERWWMSDDGKRWVFFLPKGVTFTDGTELTAEDVKFSLELLVRKESRWPFRSTFLRTEPKVLDRHTIAFDAREGSLADLDQSFAYFLGLPIVSKAHYDKVGDKGYDERPIGSGPYKLKAKRAGDAVTFEARADWRQHWRVGAEWARHGAFKEIIFRKIPEVATRVAVLRTGGADIAELTPEVMREVERAKFQIVRSPDSYVPLVTFHGIWLPSRRGYDASLPWLKKDVRQALSLALNRKEIGDKFYFGAAAPTAGPHWFHPGTLGWNPAWKPDAYDPALAKKLGDFLVTDFATLPMVSASYLYGTNPKTVKAWQPTRGKYPDRFEWVVPAR